MKKILFYINILSGGGAERVIVNLANEFAKKGYETILVASYATEGEYSVSNNVKQYYLDKRNIKTNFIKRNLSRITKLRMILRNERPEVIVSFMAEANFRAIVATLGLNIRSIISVRNDPKIAYKGIKGFVLRNFIYPLADGCVFQTENAKKWFTKKLQKKSAIILNPIKEDFYNVIRKPQKGLVVTCGRLVVQKNHILLIEAFAEVTKSLKNINLNIYGEGELKRSLQTIINNLGMNDRIKLMGSSNNIPKVLSTADLFVMSSDYEGMPNALMEAMVVGLPCISTDCPCGGPRVLLGENNGQLFRVGNKEELIKLLFECLRNSEVLHSKASYNVNPRNFSKTNIVFKWECYINEILKI